VNLDLGATGAFAWGSSPDRLREVAVRKPPGMESERPEATRGRTEFPTAIEIVRDRLGWPEARLPHRLDRIACGWLLVCRDAATVAERNETVRAGDWVKGYVARVATPPGGPESLLGEHRRYLRREGRVARVVRSGGDPSRLAVLAAAPAPDRPGECHVAIRLDTGRYHQIRAMLADLGAPLVGDAIYGGPAGSFHLEHAVLCFPPLPGEGSDRIRLFEEDGPFREVVAPAIVGSLRTLVRT
jgi:23S rRNA-/tRNA-specific pseudouridylate synthase